MDCFEILDLFWSLAEELNRKKSQELIATSGLCVTTYAREKLRYRLKSFRDNVDLKLGGPGVTVTLDHTHGLVHRAKFQRGKNGRLLAF